MPETLKQILQEIGIGAVVGAIAAVVWVLVGGPSASPWDYFIANVIVILAAGFTASAWSHWRAGRSKTREAGR